MKDKIRIFFLWIWFLLRSKSLAGYGIHSPFVFRLVSGVMHGARKSRENEAIVHARRRLLHNMTLVDTGDFGAGSATLGRTRRVCDMTRKAAIRPRFGRLLYALAEQFKPARIVELGTGTGLAAASMALGNREAEITTIEGSEEMAAVAKKNLEEMRVSNVKVIVGEFDQVLPPLLSRLEKVDMVFIDGDHRGDATLKYFELVCRYRSPECILVLDDIRWSREMRQAWKIIVSDERATVTLDLFYMGCVFFRKNMAKQHFRIRF